MKTVECANQSAANIAAVVRTKRKAQHLEPGAIVQFEQFRGQISVRMPAKADRQIANSYLLIPPNSPFPQWRWKGLYLMTNEGLGACQLQRGIAAAPEKGEGIDCQHPLRDLDSQFTGKLCGPRPVAREQCRTRQSVERVGIAGLHGERLLEARERLVIALERTEHIAALVESLDVIRAD